MSRPSLKLKQELITASAGAGKTTALINTLMSFISDYYKEKKVFPRIVVSTFTRKATRELKERMLVEAIKKHKKIIEYISYSPHLHISTLHGIFSRFIQTHGYKIGLSPGVKIVNEFESDELIISILKNIILTQNNTSLLNHYSFEEITDIVKQYILHKQNTYKTAPINKQQIREVLTKTEKELLQKIQSKKSKKNQETLSDLKKEEAQLDTFYNLSAELQKIGDKVMEIQKRKKRELGLITVNDLEVMTMEILEKEKGLLDVKENKWDFWFLDEYQDTSPLQKKILDRLSHNSSIFIVGDPQQSIYYFRGADPSVFTKKEQEFKKNKASQMKYLKNNHRSCPELIAFFNDFFPSETFNNMETPSNNYNREKIVASFILSSQENKEDTEQCEIEKKIKNLRQEGAKPSEIVILSRQNKSLQKTAQYLKNKQIPIHLHSTGSFKQRREVIDALFLLRFLLNPHDDENLIGLFRTPYCRIPDHTLASIAKEKKQHNTKSLWDFCLYGFSEKYPIQKLKHHLENTKHNGALYSFQKALISLGFFDLSYYQDPTGIREANLWKLIYSLKEYPSAGLGNLSSFIDYMLSENLKTETDQIGPSQNAVSSIESSGVQLMTIHSSKGLEFKHVILINAGAPFSHTASFPYFAYQKTGDWTLAVKPETEDKRIKNSFHKQIIKEEENITIQEFDRLLYVALTRAKETITIISTGKPGKNSWLRRFPFFTHLKAGYHTKQYYSYFVHQS